MIDTLSEIDIKRMYLTMRENCIVNLMDKELTARDKFHSYMTFSVFQGLSQEETDKIFEQEAFKKELEDGLKINNNKKERKLKI